ncbi:putative glycoside hydrolase [Cohnella suwonensis]|uniref:Glycoside hydrolase n=1 Tax=Cohnella suwonensis TaxID=696072 RepID=A0ABW0LYX3_9BACL
MNILMALFVLLNASVGGHTTEELTPGSNLWKSMAFAIKHQSSAPAEGSNDGETAEPATPTPEDPQPDAPVVKGVYVTAYSAGGSRMATLLDFLDRTELNAMVIDVKDDLGNITYKTDNPTLQKLGNPQPYIKDIHKLMTTLEEHKIYPIARVVVFKDSVLAKKHPEYSFIQKDGTIWQNKNKDKFVNPYRKEVWDYNLEIAKEAAKLGFKEVQFDYVRFPEGFEKKADNLKFTKNELSRVDIVTGFVEYAKKQLAPLGVRVSVDIFGYAASVPAAEGIGQDFVKISNSVQVISPMIYPSHYSTGWFGQKNPDTAPYATIKGAMDDTHKKLDPLGKAKPVIRPWIQDFTASWLGKGHYAKYGAAEVQAQIKALNDSGVQEFLLWNAGNKYSEGVKY